MRCNGPIARQPACRQRLQAESYGMTGPRWSIGSSWLRWDPHLHAPGTLLNNQFGNDWEGYLERIERANPAPCALGITDYFTLRGYKEIMRRREAGALRSVPLVFPNI